MIDPSEMGAIPDDQDTPVAGASDDGEDNGVDVIKQLLDYGRQKNGLGDQAAIPAVPAGPGGDQPGDQSRFGPGKKLSGNIPAIPAGPGGDQPGDPSRFGPGRKLSGNIPAIPAGPGGDQPGDPSRFGPGRKLSAIDDDDMTQSFDDGGAVEDDPDQASNVGNRQINDMVDSGVSKVRNLLPTPSVGAPNAPDRASQVGGQQINDSADEMASDVGAALKGGAQAVGGVVGQAGAAEANTAGAIADPEGVQGMVQGAGKALGAIPDAISSATAEPQSPNPVGDFIPNAKRIMNYLMGDAAPSSAVAKAEAAVDPHGEKPEGARKKEAIEAAMKQGGPEVAYPLLQANRLKAEALRHTAAAAVDHGDLDQAAQLATKAYLHIPDGNDVHFVAGKNGVTATVTEGDKVTSQQTLTPQQFKAYLTGQSMQFDNALETPPAAAIQKASQQRPQVPGGPETAPFAGARKRDAMQPRGGDTDPSAPQKPPAGTPLEAKTVEQAEALANRLFPSVSEGSQRQAFIAKIMAEGGQKYPSEENQASEKGRQAMERAKATGTSRVEVAKVGADARIHNADIHYGEGGSMDRRTQSNEATRLAQIAGSQGNGQRRDALNWSSRVLGNPMASPEDQKRARDILDHEMTNEQQQQQRAPQPGVPPLPTGQPQAPASGKPQAGPAPRPASQAPAQGAPAAMKTVRNAADYQALRSGEAYIDPNGVKKIKG